MILVDSLLTREIAALQVVLTTLQAERVALEERAPEALLAASNAKAEAVARAADLERQHRALHEANAEAPSAPATSLTNELKRLAAECRQLNEANGLLIRGQRRRIEGSLNVLRGGRAAPDTYDRTGETNVRRGPRTPLASY